MMSRKITIEPSDELLKELAKLEAVRIKVLKN
jgi:hypothetical protein